MLRDHGFTGIRHGAHYLLPDLYPSYALTGATKGVYHTQMLYMELFIETGALGFVSFMWLMLRSVKDAAFSLVHCAGRETRGALVGCCASFIGIAVASIFEYIWFYPRVLFAFSSFSASASPVYACAGWRRRLPALNGNKKLIYAALFAALCCVITMYPKFPTLFGYIHAGDALVLLAAYVLGPVWGSLAAALGSSLADLMAGYVQYFPGTFVIKAVMALIAGAVLTKFGAKHPIRYAMLGGLAAECVMILGYFGYEGWILATAGVPQPASRRTSCRACSALQHLRLFLPPCSKLHMPGESSA